MHKHTHTHTHTHKQTHTHTHTMTRTHTHTLTHTHTHTHNLKLIKILIFCDQAQRKLDQCIGEDRQADRDREKQQDGRKDRHPAAYRELSG